MTPRQSSCELLLRFLGLIVLVALFEATPGAGVIGGAAETPERVLLFALFSLTSAASVR